MKVMPTVEWFCGNDKLGEYGSWYQKAINLEILDPQIGPIIADVCKMLLIINFILLSFL